MARIFGTFGATVREIETPDEETQFEFCGETFTIAPFVGAAPMMKFAAALDASLGHDSIFLSAMDALIRDCLASRAEYERFIRVATEHKASIDDIFEVCKGVWVELSARPTRRPADSSDGPPDTSTSSSTPATAPASSPRSRSPRNRASGKRTG